ncbi:hypothetical protein T190130A13A_30471 [Tenacibaculum sp. 190130A14a]|uniref:Uncharacterized protein n=1 Tax=Tenacibaculum polynesiense TaxID=3137857 RepID=A0ABM9PCX7_9FLAO
MLKNDLYKERYFMYLLFGDCNSKLFSDVTYFCKLLKFKK